MLNNNEGANEKMPYEIQEVMDRYKNQITTLGLDVSRLEKLKARTEIAISNLAAEERDKKEMVEKVSNKIKELAVELNGLGERRVIALKEIKEAEDKRNLIEKEARERLAHAINVEKESRIKELKLAEDRKTLDAREEKNRQETLEVARKKTVISELISKL